VAVTAATQGPARDLDAEIAALDRKRADDFRIVGHSVFGRLYATEALHRLVPDRIALRIAWAIGWLRWYWPSARRKAIARVSLTVAGTPREDEVRKLARRELSINAMCDEAGWRRSMLRRTPIEGLERLEAALASDRGVLLTGAHIGGGAAGALREQGVSFYSAVGAWLDPDAPIERRGYKHYRAQARRRWAEENGTRFVIMGGSFEVLRALLQRGETCTVFCDSPGKMRTRMAGKVAYLASGPAMLSDQTGAVVVPTVALLDTRGPHVEILEPIDPRKLNGPQEIADRLASIYGDLMVRHPEQVQPLGFTRDVFKEEGAAYPSDLWWFPPMRTRAKNKAINVLRRLRGKLDGGR
jgi:lauroyl/myristoyl acyltransferase